MLKTRICLRQWLLLLLFSITLGASLLATQLYHHAQEPIDAVLVLGGSIRREIAAAEAAAQGSQLPMLISQGSQPPCIRVLFDRVAAPLDQVWLETCAQSTFDNYRYSLPILKQWQAHHVQVVTSPSHVPRAAWLAKILLGSHGIWTEMSLVEEAGVPGNVENSLKTIADVTRSVIWAIISQVYRPRCENVISLSSVDLADWQAAGFTCEHQGNIESPPE